MQTLIGTSYYRTPVSKYYPLLGSSSRRQLPFSEPMPLGSEACNHPMGTKVARILPGGGGGGSKAVTCTLLEPCPVSSDRSRFTTHCTLRSLPLQHSAMLLHGVTRTPHLLNLKSFGYLYAEVEYTLVQGSSLESCTALRSTSSSVRDP